jgi:multidrug efflux pump subunit AcrA (membrane-fusion protein)
VAPFAVATLVPAEAVVRRDGGRGVYRVVPGEPPTAAYPPVDVGIEGDERVEITEPALSGRVVTLGQQMLADGAPVVVSELPES